MGYESLLCNESCVYPLLDLKLTKKQLETIRHKLGEYLVENNNEKIVKRCYVCCRNMTQNEIGHSYRDGICNYSPCGYVLERLEEEYNYKKLSKREKEKLIDFFYEDMKYSGMSTRAHNKNIKMTQTYEKKYYGEENGPHTFGLDRKGDCVSCKSKRFNI